MADRRLDLAFLARLLELEERQGFQDRAVLGGLSGLVQRWGLAQTRSEPWHSLGRLLAPYSRLDPGRRAAVLQAVRALLARGGPAPPPADPPARPAATLSPAPPADPAPVAGRPAKTAAGRRARPARSERPAPRGEPAEGLEAPVVRLHGVGPTYARRLARLGIRTIRDLLYHFPHRYLDYRSRRRLSELSAGEQATVLATVISLDIIPTRRGGLRRIEAVLADETGQLRALWFRHSDRFPLVIGRQYVFSGPVEREGLWLVLRSPEFEPFDGRDLVHTGRLVPVYPLTEGIDGRWLRGLIKRVVERFAPLVEEFLPADLRRAQGLLDLPTAIAHLHFPATPEQLARARQRLAFDELFLIQLGVLVRKWRWQSGAEAPVIPTDQAVLRAFLDGLPFRLTGAQARALQEIAADLARPVPMSRLLQGDVGSGKTVVATAAMLLAVAAGYQAALMAPTEILAEQHARTVQRLLEAGTAPALLAGRRGRPDCPRVVLLTGAVKGAERRWLLQAIAGGTADIVIGTHALIEEAVEFHRLGLAIVDEQHRFGVLQRAALRQKGYNPHVLVMSATPIPRTLALTLYGDLDLSVIDELPPGRQPIVTRWLGPEERAAAYDFVRREVQAGRQAFIVCPLVEESEKLEARAATAEFRRLQDEVFPDLRLGLLHGRLAAAEKEAVMQAFQRGEIQVLVCTPVVEVGIDVPNATVMLIESADRFGLAQLHQFRGRVGRGPYPSYCLLLADAPSAEARQRLGEIERTQDGFALAEADLRLRGPGEFLGTRQSGLPDLRVASLTDQAMVLRARQAAQALLARDPELEQPAHQALAAQLRRFWHDRIQTDLS